jgi:ribosomal-protein-alanine N-acetyltransferase
MLETERLLLRKFTLDDLDTLLALRADPDVTKYIGGERAMDRDWNLQRLNFHINSYDENGYGMLAMIWKETGEMIGWCGLAPLEDSGEIEVGYGMSKPWWGRGIAFEAARASLKWGFETAGLERIVAVADPENNNSWGIMKKLGMTYEGIRHHYGNDLVFYAVSKQDFLANNK